MSFYSWTVEYVESLDVETADAYCKAARVLTAKRDLEMTNVVSYPHLKERKTQTAHYKRLQKIANPIENIEVMTAEQIKAQMRGVMSGSN